MAVAEKKPLIEIIDSNEKKDTEKNESNDSDKKLKIIEDVSEKKTEIIEKSTDNYTVEKTETGKDEVNTEGSKLKYFNKTGIIVEGDTIIDHDKKTITKNSGTKSNKKMKKTPIIEIPLEKKAVPMDTPPKSEEKNENVKGDDKSDNNEDSKASTSEGSGERRPSG